MQLEHGSCNCQIGTGGPATSNVSIYVCPFDSPWAHWAGMGKKKGPSGTPSPRMDPQ